MNTDTLWADPQIAPPPSEGERGLKRDQTPKGNGDETVLAERQEGGAGPDGGGESTTSPPPVISDSEPPDSQPPIIPGTTRAGVANSGAAPVLAAKGEPAKAGTPNPRPTLSPDEARELAICEEIIDRTFDALNEGSLALATIRDKGLYRGSFDTFEEYVSATWSIGVRQAHRLCFAANFAKSITDQVTPGSLLLLPRSEKQVRSLNRLGSERERIAAWREACDLVAPRLPTSKEVERVVDGRLGIVRPLDRQSPIAKGQPAEAGTPNRAVIDAQPSGNREQRAREALRRASAAARDLVDTLGTADSLVAARAALMLEQLDGIGDHLARLERMQESRT